MMYVVTAGDRSHRVEVQGGDGRYQVSLDGQTWEVDARQTAPGIRSLLIGGVSYVADVAGRDDVWAVDVGRESFLIRVEEATRHVIRTHGGGAAAAAGGQTVAAPLPGRITHVAVRVGDRIAAGDAVVVIEAMKMENELRASGAGTVQEVRVEPGQAVNAGDVLVVIG